MARLSCVAMSSSKFKPVPHGPSLLLFLFAIVTTVLLVARGVVTSTSQAREIAVDENEDDAEPVGASRGWGGNNKTEHLLRKDFPWIFVLFRDPDKSYRVQMDGYPTGYALELKRNVFLANKYAMRRASRYSDEVGSRVLMSAKRAQDIGVLNPNPKQWPKAGERGLGNITSVQSIGFDFGIFVLNPWTALSEEDAKSRQSIPDLDPSLQVHRYPTLNSDEHLARNCYLYTFAATDHDDVLSAADEFGLPPPDKKINKPFTPRELRYFTRSPVKLIAPCQNNRKCKFVFDQERYKEEHVQGKYSARRARVCGRWQDAGAPIMCGDKPPFWSGYNEQGVFYERKYLKLSYVVEVPFGNVTCSDEFTAYRLALPSDQVKKDGFVRPWGK